MTAADVRHITSAYHENIAVYKLYLAARDEAARRTIIAALVTRIIDLEAALQVATTSGRIDSRNATRDPMEV